MNIKIKNVIDVLTAQGISREQTVDKLEFGDPDAIVTGIATTFLATQEIVEKAKELNVNLIITHEGIFYSHWDRTKILQSDKVYWQKRNIIEESEMGIFRFHDYIHDKKPDGIMKGLLQTLDWTKFEIKDKQVASVLEIPTMTVEEIILYIKRQLDIQYVRYIGDLKMPCRRVGLLVGYRGTGDLAIKLIAEEGLELVIYGEGPEWETPEYIRDAVYQGRQKALVVLGHAESEVPGMKYLAHWIQNKFPSIPVYFIPSKPIFQIF